MTNKKQKTTQHSQAVTWCSSSSNSDSSVHITNNIKVASSSLKLGSQKLSITWVTEYPQTMQNQTNEFNIGDYNTGDRNSFNWYNLFGRMLDAGFKWNNSSLIHPTLQCLHNIGLSKCYFSVHPTFQWQYAGSTKYNLQYCHLSYCMHIQFTIQSSDTGSYQSVGQYALPW